jgi:alkylhydroperoxidase/carboxymuconolactone decarboxylase family protein YurZ
MATVKKMTAEQILESIKSRRGYMLPVHQLIADVDVDLLERYDALASALLFADEARQLDLKTRYLVLVGITTAVRGDPEGIVWSAQRAIKHGASKGEVLEAILLVALPGGVPCVEEATHVLERVFAE